MRISQGAVWLPGETSRRKHGNAHGISRDPWLQEQEKLTTTRSWQESSGLVQCLFPLRPSACYPSARKLTGNQLPTSPDWIRAIQPASQMFVPHYKSVGIRFLHLLCTRQCAMERAWQRRKIQPGSQGAHR